MKTLIAVLAVALALASPALGQGQTPDRGVSKQRQSAKHKPPKPPVVRHSDNPAFDVYLGQRYIGSDPDPHVRFELLRDANRHND
jgi:hypothetical protein